MLHGTYGETHPIRSQPLTAKTLSGQECAVLLTAHSSLTIEAIVEHAPLVFDTRGVTAREARNVVRL
jgi:UDP-N-acetyl-D-glucosamine dehydrogenase